MCNIEADHHGLGPEIRSLRLTSNLSLTPHASREGRDESTVNMRAFLASEDHRLVYNEMRGICNQYVQEAHRQLRISSLGYITRHKALVMADPDCGSGPAHVDGVAGGLLLIIFLNCCAPLTAARRGRDVTIVDALKWAALGIWEVATASPLGVVPWLEQNRPEVLAELRKARNLCTGCLAQSKSLVPLGVADDRYRTDVCQGNEDAATYSRHGLAFLLLAQDVHVSQPKGGVNHAFATGCPRCKDLAGVTPCFRIFESLHPNTCAMMPGPEWQIMSYHVPGMSAFLHEVDHEDEARHRKHETARTTAAAKEMRHWYPEAHIRDDEYILADRGANARRPGQRGATARRPGQRGANAPRPGQVSASARRLGYVGDSCNPAY
eukprot:jgi/Tetstr1/429722/TSEL_019615.t1